VSLLFAAMTMNFWCLVWSVVTGLCTTLGVNLLQYMAHLERSGKRLFSTGQKGCSYVVNILIMLVGTATFLLATRNGPVSVAMPIVTASSLLANMLVQTVLGIQRYNKPMRVGTWVLTFAVICLIDVGPSDQVYADPLGLLMTPAGIAVSVAQLVLLGLGAIGVKMMKNSSPQSSPKIFAYGMVVATATAMGASVGKVMQLPGLPSGAFYSFIGVYLISGIISFGVAAIAATECDASVYLPVRSCLQLLVNAATGMFVWQDWRVLTDWIAYAAVYLLITLGVYSVSSIDMFPSVTGIKTLPFNDALDKCVQAWNDANETKDATESIAAFREMAKCGLDTNDIEPHALLDLTITLMAKHKESIPPTDVMAWAHANIPQLKEYYAKQELEIGCSFSSRSSLKRQSSREFGGSSLNNTGILRRDSSTSNGSLRESLANRQHYIGPDNETSMPSAQLKKELSDAESQIID